jgi:hypothetical protein
MKHGSIPCLVRGIIKPNAANGQTAFSDTAQYRNDYPPTNYPSLSGVSFPGGCGNATTPVQFSFSYTQGAQVATHFAIYIKLGGGSVYISDPHFLVSAGAGGSITLPFNISQTGTYSFGVAALAMCKDGPEFNATISTFLNMTIGSTVVLGTGSAVAVFQGPAQLYGTLSVYGAMGGKIDFDSLDGVFVPRIVTDSTATPATPNMATGEEIWFICSNAAQQKQFVVRYDGVNRFYIGVNYGTGAFVGGINLF